MRYLWNILLEGGNKQRRVWQEAGIYKEEEANKAQLQIT